MFANTQKIKIILFWKNSFMLLLFYKYLLYSMILLNVNIEIKFLIISIIIYNIILKKFFYIITILQIIFIIFNNIIGCRYKDNYQFFNALIIIIIFKTIFNAILNAKN